jgi:hypothetical protein
MNTQDKIAPADIKIGTVYTPRGRKHHLKCTVVDVLKTYNSAGDLVNTRYVSEHQFLGQTIKDFNVLGTTVLMGMTHNN